MFKIEELKKVLTGLTSHYTPIFRHNLKKYGNLRFWLASYPILLFAIVCNPFQFGAVSNAGEESVVVNSTGELVEVGQNTPSVVNPTEIPTEMTASGQVNTGGTAPASSDSAQVALRISQINSSSILDHYGKEAAISLIRASESLAAEADFLPMFEQNFLHQQRCNLALADIYERHGLLNQANYRRSVDDIGCPV